MSWNRKTRYTQHMTRSQPADGASDRARSYGVNGHFDRISPHFRNSDIGFLASRTNKRNINYGVNLYQPEVYGAVGATSSSSS